MKIGLRTPSLKKSLKARTTGRAKRAFKSAVNPVYGKKGVGVINNPKKAVYNAVYNKTTIGLKDIVNSGTKSNGKVRDKQEYKSVENRKANNISSENQTLKNKSAKLNEECNMYRKNVCETTNPCIFFGSYKLLIDKLKELVQYENSVQWYDGTPSQMLEETYKVKEKAINEFIKRYFNKLVSNKSIFSSNEKIAKKFKTQLETWGKIDMNDNNRKFYQTLINNMMEKK